MNIFKFLEVLHKYRIHIFPVILLLVFIALVSLKLSGTSIGIYHNYLYGNNIKDPNLIFGNPQPIRSDEWLVNTQLAIAQERNNYDTINGNINHGINMSIAVDAPYREWSIFFKPQNLAFFILPFEYAFAFKWWFLLLTLLLSGYYLIHRLVSGVPHSILLSIITSFSPFVFWWYQTSTIATLAYGFLILLIAMCIIDNKPIRFFKMKISTFLAQTLRTVALAYFLSCFALILYPPFQIPVVIVGLFFVAGYLFSHATRRTKREWLIVIVPLLTAGILTITIASIFVITRSEAINAIRNTVYPGERIVASGGYDIKRLLVSYLQPQLQGDDSGSKYTKNQSEDSNFIVSPLFLFVPAILIFASIYIRRKKIDYILLALILSSGLFLSQLFIPGIDPLAKLFLLHLVPHDRLLIGLGFLSTLLLIYLSRLYISKEFKLSKPLTYTLLGYCLVYFMLMLWAGVEIHKLYIDFIPSKKLLLLLASLVMLGLLLFLINKQRIGLLILAIFSVASVYQIHPLYRGLGHAYNNQVFKTIESVADDEDVWAAAQNTTIENFPQMSGQKSVTGVLAYPNLDFWSKYSEQAHNTIYNRYAHTFLSTNDTDSLVLVAPDLYAISYSCTRKIAEEIDYVVSSTPLPGSCYQLLKTIPYPNMTFYIYKQ